MLTEPVNIMLEDHLAMITLYGISNCDTVRKARRWLDQAGVEHQFHDYRKQGVDVAWLARVINRAGLATVVNKRGRAYRMLDEMQQASLEDLDTALITLGEFPAVIKRPILDDGKDYLVGFDEDRYRRALLS